MISEKPLGEESKQLMESVSQKQKKKIHKSEVEDREDARGGGVNCLSLSIGCKVADTGGEDSADSSNKRWSSASEKGKGLMTICGTEETNRARELFWERYNSKFPSESVKEKLKHIFLPDDLVEMCLMRLPLTSLMKAHLVCKKWRDMVTTQRFLQLRRESSFQTLWLFMFAALENCSSTGEIHGYDVSQDKWHTIEADLIKGRFMYAVTSVHKEIFIIGGCSMERRFYKSHRGILVFSLLTKSWHKIASMRHARSLPIVAASEVTSEFSIMQIQKNHEDVYLDPQRLAVLYARRQHKNSADQDATKLARQKLERLKLNNTERFVLIAIGGTGLFEEPLNSGEIYDSATDTWSEIQGLPMDFGVVSCGVICNGIFYAYSKNDKLSGYDIERGLWIEIQTSPIPLRILQFYPKLVSCNQRLFILSVSDCDEGGGEIGKINNAVRKLWELDLVYLTWTEVSIHPDAPMDWHATYVSDQNILMGVEMFTICGQALLGCFTLCDLSAKEVSWRHISRTHRIQKRTSACMMNQTVALLHL